MANTGELYFDSALIAKFYLNEPGREVIRGMARSAGKIVSSAIGVAEISAAFHRKFRERAIEADTFSALHAQFAHDLRRGLWTLVPVSESLLEAVQALFRRLDSAVFLRSLDALHLVTAKVEDFAEIHSNDRHVLAACAAAGMRGINPLA